MFLFLSGSGGNTQAHAHYRAEDLEYCRDLVQQLLASKFAEGYASGQAEEASEVRPRLSPVGMVGEGTYTLILSLPNTLVVGLLFQLFQPLLLSWVTALTVLEVVRGPLKVGGDYVFNLAKSGVRLSRRGQLILTGGYTLVLAVLSSFSVILTQIGGEVILEFVGGNPIRLDILWFDVWAGFFLGLTMGSVAIYTQGFVIVAWVRENIAEHKQARWLTLTRSYNRMFVNYAGLFLAAWILLRLS